MIPIWASECAGYSGQRGDDQELTYVDAFGWGDDSAGAVNTCSGVKGLELTPNDAVDPAESAVGNGHGAAGSRSIGEFDEYILDDPNYVER